MRPFEPPKYKEQKKQRQGARKSSRLQLCRPKLKTKLNEIEISFFKIAGFITVTLKLRV